MDLFDLEDRYKDIQDHLESSDIEEGKYNELNRYWREIELMPDKINDKIINLAAIVKNLKAQDKALCDHIADMDKKRNALENKIKWFKDRIMQLMASFNIDNVKGHYLTVIKQKSSPRLVYGFTTYPKEYTDMVPTLNKVKLKEDLKQGLYVEGARLEQDEHIRIL